MAKSGISRNLIVEDLIRSGRPTGAGTETVSPFFLPISALAKRRLRSTGSPCLISASYTPTI